MAGLLDWITGAVKQQYAQGAPYREAIGGLLQGDPTKFGLLAQEFNRKAQTPEGALDVALNINPMLTFIGKGSKLWNSDLAKKAVELEKKGIAPEEIWRQTGTAKFADGKWRQEISDVGSKITQKPTLDILKQNKTMPSLLEHPSLYKAYDDLSGISIKPAFDAQGYYSKSENAIGLAPQNESANWRMNIYKDAKKKTLLHEGQHAIQEMEGWAKGGSSQEFINDLIEKKADATQSIAELNAQMKDVVKMMDVAKANQYSDPVFDKRISALQNKYDDLISQRNQLVKDAQIDPREEAYKQYQRLGGEAESRLTERRMNLTPEQRLQYFPYAQGQYGLDVPYNELKIRGLLE